MVLRWHSSGITFVVVYCVKSLKLNSVVQPCITQMMNDLLFPRRVERSKCHSMLKAHRQHTTVHDFHTAFAVSEIIGSAQPVDYVGHFVQPNGRAVFWFEGEGDHARIVADANVFSSDQLMVVDATNLQAGATSRIGSLHMPAVLPLDVIAELLVTSDVVLTYVHERSSLTMDLLSTDESATIFRFSGTHEFFTSKRNVKPVHFEVRIDHEGNVTVAGAAGCPDGEHERLSTSDFRDQAMRS